MSYFNIIASIVTSYVNITINVTTYCDKTQQIRINVTKYCDKTQQTRQHIAIKYNKHVLNMLPALPYRIANIATIICDRFSLNCDYIFCRKLYW